MAKKVNMKASELQNSDSVVLSIEAKLSLDKNKVVEVKKADLFQITWAGAQGILEKKELDGRAVSLVGVLVRSAKKGGKPTVEPVDDDVFGTLSEDTEEEFSDPAFIPGITQ